ncbi:MAG: DUF91 domain-containing protein [Candidatus Aenigmarchaeota archaeon]|nr:DUF91 domain-containing protein [Candidatus Aenigmarchaeota archaeon]
MWSESLFEDIITKYSDLIEDGLQLEGRQVSIYGKRLDLLFKDRFNHKLIVELKINALDRTILGQVMDYEGAILSEKEPNTRIMIVANRIPMNFRKSMEFHGIEFKEITLHLILEFLEKNNEKELIGRIQNEKIRAEPCIERATTNQTVYSDLDDAPKNIERNSCFLGQRDLAIGDLKLGMNKTWDYPRLQINLTDEDVEKFGQSLHEEFRIYLRFPEGKIIDKKGNEYKDGFFTTNIIKDQPGRFGKGTVYAICSIWKSRKKLDGILIGWLKSHNIRAGDKIKLITKEKNFYELSPTD